MSGLSNASLLHASLSEHQPKQDEKAHAISVFQSLVNRELTKDEAILAQLAFSAGVCDGLQQALGDVRATFSTAAPLEGTP